MPFSFAAVYMKKLLVIFLALCYLFLSSGFTRYAHMCNGMATELYSLKNTGHQNSDKPCPICLDKKKDLKQKKKDCCRHEAKVVKVDAGVKKQNQFEASVKFFGDAIPNKMLGTVFDFLVLSNATRKHTPYLSVLVPLRNNPLYMLYCVYRI